MAFLGLHHAVISSGTVAEQTNSCFEMTPWNMLLPHCCNAPLEFESRESTDAAP